MDLEQRKKYLGGTDAAAVLAMSRWRTPLQVWAEKTGQVESPDISGKLPVKLGNKLEQTVAELFTEETGKKVRRVNDTIFHPEHAFLGANIDRRIVGEDAFLECKTASPWKYREWEDDEIPQEYILQCYHYLAVTGMKKCYIAVLIGNQAFKWKEILYDKDIINDVVTKEVAFWNLFVETKSMPMSLSAQDGDILFELFPDAVDEVIDLDDRAERLVEDLEALKADEQSLKGTIERKKNFLKAMLGDSACGETANFKITWKNQSSTRLNSKSLKEADPDLYAKFAETSQFRVLRYSVKKGETKNG